MQLLWRTHILQWWSKRALDAAQEIPMYVNLRAWQRWWIKRKKEAMRP